jgi:NADPH2:quinone reductase
MTGENMKALLCKEYGPVESLVIGETEAPALNSYGIRVRVRAAGLNFPDTLIIENKYQYKPTLPFSPGGELAGEVIEVGDKVTRFSVGDRVMGLSGFGAFAEQVVLGESSLTAVPDAMSDEEAAAFSMVYGTSYHALKQRADLQPEETLLVLGAAGGVGLAAVELGHIMGATVIAAAGSDEKLEAAKEAGATYLINYREQNLKEAVKALAPGGVDVIYDPVGGDFTEQALRCIGWKGRHLIIGFAAGDIPRIPVNLTLLKGCQLVGVFWGQFTLREQALNEANTQHLLGWYAEGKLRPRISEVFAFGDYVRAFRALTERRAIGKLVLRSP